MNGEMREPRPIYVGYLPLPARHRRLLRVLVPAIGAAAVGLGWLTAALQRDPGPAHWSTDARTRTGTLVLDPYPVLLPDEPGAPPLLLVADGKFGAAGLGELDGKRVEIRGRLLERGEDRLLEVTGGTPALAIGGPARDLPPGETSRVTLRGEIVDSKCCLGAMKPGEGKTHRACATLCIRGGIPPILVSGDADAPVYTLVTDGAGGPANDMVLPYIAEPVEVTGRLRVREGLRVLALDSIGRLGR